MTYRFQGYGADPSLDPTGIASARLPMYGPYPTGLTYGPSGPVLGPATAPTDVMLPPPDNGGAGQPGGNGGGAQPPPPAQPGALDRARAWWDARSGLEKGAVIVGGAAAAALLLWALLGKRGGGYRKNGRKRRRRYKRNLRGAAVKRLRRAKPGGHVEVRGRTYKVGRITKVKGGRRFGHKVPPKKYRTTGARRPDDYAWPAGYMYPLYFRTRTGKLKRSQSAAHVRAAARYFGKNKHLYPLAVRKTIARNINKAKKRFGIGGEPARP